MRKFVSTICIAITLLYFFNACTPQPEKFFAPAQFYYRAADYSYHTDDGVIRAETRETNSVNNDIILVLNWYLRGPASKELISPFPHGAQVLDVKQGNQEVTVILNRVFSDLSGIDLTLSIACLAMTVLEYTGTNTVHICCRDSTIGGKDVITVTCDILLLIDDTAQIQNNT